MRRLVCNIISVFHSFIRFFLLKVFHPKGLKYSMIERVSPNVVVEMNKNSSLYLGKKVRIHSGTKIKVREQANIIIGNGVKINYNCIFVSKNSIVIGEGTEFGPGVLIYDHDHDYKSGIKNEKFLCTPVEIGKNCWIGANSIILRGAKIGDNSVIAAGSIISGVVPNDSLIIQKRISSIKNI